MVWDRHLILTIVMVRYHSINLSRFLRILRSLVNSGNWTHLWARLLELVGRSSANITPLRSNRIRGLVYDHSVWCLPFTDFRGLVEG